ncbi:hypothetical protein D0N36_14435 [Hymenobacter lapidiphilus]|nr:hypothetical protein D0N36_14435 [Hymenobacter sp. CCM 8763]
MGAKHACFTCCHAFNAPYGSIGPAKCPTCGAAVVIMTQRFRPPKKRETAKWAVAQFLADHGFYYQPVYEHPWGGQFMKYPTTMPEAKEFVKTYQAQAAKRGVFTNVPVATLHK